MFLPKLKIMLAGFASVAFIMLYFFFRGSNLRLETVCLAKKVRTNNSVAKIRKWVEENAQKSSKSIPETEWHSEVINLQPKWVEWIENGEGVELGWGSGLKGHRGIRIFKSKDVTATHSNEYIEWVDDAAYCWYAIEH